VGGSGGGAAVAPPQSIGTMKAASWREMSNEDLEQKLKELTEELFNLRFQLSMGVSKNPSRVQQARRDLARAKTILRERQLTRAS
jgi:large subunit ribosomal protein L29